MDTDRVWLHSSTDLYSSCINYSMNAQGEDRIVKDV